MSEEPCASRTHEPSLRELTAELDGLRKLVAAEVKAADTLAKERDKWYTERDKDRQASVDKALTAAKEQTASSFAASKEAILKAEEAQRAYNTAHNDLARKMDEQNKATIPRQESEARFRTIEEKVNEVRTAIAAGGGALVGGRAVKDESRANVAIFLSAIGFLLMLSTLLLKLAGK